MTKNDLRKGLRKINALENELMRPLTEEEINLLMSNGDEALVYDKLGMDEDDLRVLRDLRTVISAYCTLTEDEFDEVLTTIDAEPVYFVLRTIVNKLEELDEENRADHVEEMTTDTCKDVDKPANKTRNRTWIEDLVDILSGRGLPEEPKEENLKENVIDSIIERLKAGEEVELEPDLMNEVFDAVWEKYDNVSLVARNNKLKAQFK